MTRHQPELWWSDDRNRRRELEAIAATAIPKIVAATRLPSHPINSCSAFVYEWRLCVAFEIQKAPNNFAFDHEPKITPSLLREIAETAEHLSYLLRSAEKYGFAFRVERDFPELPAMTSFAQRLGRRSPGRKSDWGLNHFFGRLQELYTLGFNRKASAAPNGPTVRFLQACYCEAIARNAPGSRTLTNDQVALRLRRILRESSVYPIQGGQNWSEIGRLLTTPKG